MKQPRIAWLEWLLYVGAALAAVWRALPAGRVVGDGVDLSGTLWHYWWLGHCLATGTDPRTTDLMYHPLGKDLFAANGSNIVDAALSVPFSAVLGPIDGQPVFVAAILLLNAATFRVLARHVLPSALSVTVATLAWELNPYVLFELADGRPTQALLPCVPLALVCFLRALSPEGTRRDAVLAGALTAVQAWIYWFMGYFLAAAYLWLVIHRLWRAPDPGAVLRRVALAGAVCLAGVALPALAMAQALEVPGPLNPAADDGRGRGHVRQSGLSGTLPFTGPGPWMLDLPAVTLGLALWLGVGPGRARWGGLLATLGLVALGPELGLGARLPTLMNPPYVLARETLPFFNRLWFPYRAMSVGMVPACLAIGFGVAWAAQRRGSRASSGLAAAWAVLFLAGLHARGLLPLTHKEVAVPASARFMAEQTAGAVIHLPFGLSQRFLVWHLEAPLPHLGGLGESSPIQWPQDFWTRLESDQLRPLMLAARRPGLPVSWREQHAHDLRTWGFRWVVFHKDRAALEIQGLEPPPKGWTDAAIAKALGELIEQLSDMLGEPLMAEGDLITWDLWRQATPPPELDAAQVGLGVERWTREEPPLHVRVLKRDARDQFTRTPGFGALEPEPGGPPKTLRRGTPKKRRGPGGPPPPR